MKKLNFENSLFKGIVGKFDKDKKNVIVFDYVDDIDFSLVDGAAKFIKKKLKEDFNVLTIFFKSKKNISENEFVIRPKFFDTLDRLSKIGEIAIQNNLGAISKEFNELIKNYESYGNFEFLFFGTSSYFILPPTAYIAKKDSEELNAQKNEYFDYLNDDDEVLKIIKNTNKKVFSDKNTIVRKFAPYAIVNRIIGLPLILSKILFDNNKFKKVVSYMPDPNFGFRAFCDGNDIESLFLCYCDDDRGTRNFKKSNLAQIQQYYKELSVPKDLEDDFLDDEPVKSKIEKTGNVIFIGTILHNKGARMDVWDEFLKDFNYKDSIYRIPLKANGIPSPGKDDSLGKKKLNEQKKEKKEIHEKLEIVYDEIINHPLYKGYIMPNKATEEVKKYKFGLVFRCVSHHNSFTNKVFEYVYNDMLPLIDYKFDPDYVYIPKELQDKVLIKNSDDIVKLADKYQDETLRQEVLNEFKKIFNLGENFSFEKCIQEDFDKIVKFAEEK